MMTTEAPSSSNTPKENQEEALSLDLELSTIPIGDTAEETPVANTEVSEEAAAPEPAEAEISLDPIQESSASPQISATAEESSPVKPSRRLLWVWVGAASTSLLLLGTAAWGLWFYSSHHTENIPTTGKSLESSSEEDKITAIKLTPTSDHSTPPISSPTQELTETAQQTTEPNHNQPEKAVSAAKQSAAPTSQNDTIGLNCQLGDRQLLKESLRKCLKEIH